MVFGSGTLIHTSFDACVRALDDADQVVAINVEKAARLLARGAKKAEIAAHELGPVPARAPDTASIAAHDPAARARLRPLTTSRQVRLQLEVSSKLLEPAGRKEEEMSTEHVCTAAALTGSIFIPSHSLSLLLPPSSLSPSPLSLVTVCAVRASCACLL